MLRTLQDLVDDVLADDPEAPALVAAGAATWTRRGLREDARCLAAGLIASGVQPGQVVGLLGPASGNGSPRCSGPCARRDRDAAPEQMTSTSSSG